MRIFLLAAAAMMGATAIPSVAQAQYHYRGDRSDYREYRRDVRQAQRECRRDLRRADSRREYRRELRDCRRDLREARRDYRRDVRNDRRYAYRPYRGQPARYWDGRRWRTRW